MHSDELSQPKNIPSEFARAHVLIIDDSQPNRIMLREVCKKLEIGIIDEADDGDTALDLITRFRPDLLLLDIHMPRMDGYELMRRLQDNRMNEGLAILVQTSMQSEDERVRCFNCGATDVVSRPFHLDELKARICAHLRSAIAARVLFDFRNRIQSHIEITHAFLDAILPTPEKAAEITERYGLTCSAVYKPHDEIGGDLWLLYPLDDEQLSIILIDASAHGLAGAINALRVDCLVQEYHDHLYDPASFLTRLDAAMAKISFGQLFAGAVVITYHRSSGIIRYAGSNIPSPLLKSRAGVSELKTRGLPLGSGMVQPKTSSASLPIGASLVLSSDGWLDGNAAETMKVLENAKSNGTPLAVQLAPQEPLPDDLTLIALQRR